MSDQEKKKAGAQPDAEMASSSELNLDELTQLWQQTPYDAEALLRSVQARSTSQRVKHYFEIGLTVLTVGLLLYAMRGPLNAVIWAFVLAGLPAVLWYQWLITTTRRSARYSEPHDAQSLLHLAMQQCLAEIRLAELARKCCLYAALFGAVWLPWLAISSWPLEGRDRTFVPFAFIWWIGWLAAMYWWADRKHKLEQEQLARLQSWESTD